MFLEWIRDQVENLSCSMDKISDYNDLRNVIKVGGLIDTASDGK